MNFFADQQRALTQSKRLVLLFGVAVLAIVALVALVVGLVIAGAHGEQTELRTLRLADIIGPVAVAMLITLAIIVGATAFKTLQLRSGGGAVARKLGGTLVDPDTTRADYRRLRNVVEEIAIASGVPVPEIYVLEQEAGINAFAAGYTAADAAVAVTRGTLDQLSRSELQGVIAHEFSHILNGDMRLNIRLMGLLFGILAIAIMARTLLRFGRAGRGNRNGGAILAAGVAIMIVGYIGVFFGRLIKASVSRQREYLADASAVQFTRDNSAVAGALKKIAALSEGSRLRANDGEEVAHMLFGDGVGYSRLFATHPPLMDRIKRIEPGFRPEEIADLARQLERTAERASQSAEAATAAPESAGGVRLPGFGKLPGMDALPTGVGGAVILAQIGNPDMADFQQAQALRTALPPALEAAARDSGDAPALVLAILVHAADGDGDLHLELIAQQRGTVVRASVEALVQACEQLHPAQRVPLAALAFPALKQQPPEALADFIALIDQLIHVNGEVSVFEYALGSTLRAQLSDSLTPSAARPFGKRELSSTGTEAASVLAVLALLGHADSEQEAALAFTAGLNHALPGSSIPYAPPGDWVAVLDTALPELDALTPEGKSRLLEALVITLSHDGTVTIEEAETLRAVCARLHLPVPPLRPDQV